MVINCLYLTYTESVFKLLLAQSELDVRHMCTKATADRTPLTLQTYSTEHKLQPQIVCNTSCMFCLDNNKEIFSVDQKQTSFCICFVGV